MAKKIRARVGAGRVRAKTPRSTCFRAMAVILALSMDEVNLAVVILNKFAMGLLHLIQRRSFI
ncbi:MAG: hypothetical protein E6I80_11660 [Chloroflexi bacterium]|nr:MAG: hypothetical protein E6I80_11660 [Chloroflexota bacterium]